MSSTERSHQGHGGRVGGGHVATCGWFWAWAVVGAAGIIGVVALGWIVLGPALVAGTAIARKRTAQDAAPGLLAGAGLVFLLVAYIQRQGPGTTCWHTATAGGCDQHLNPIPWLVIGLILVTSAVLLPARRGR